MSLGITTHRKETSAGFVFSMVVAFSYFFLIILAQMFDKLRNHAPPLFVWLPKFIFGLFGAVMLFRPARR